MDAKIQEINLAANICNQLKNIYFKETKWVECHNEVAAKLKDLMAICRLFYKDKTDKEVLTELLRYSDQDIIDVFAN